MPEQEPQESLEQKFTRLEQQLADEQQARQQLELRISALEQKLGDKPSPLEQSLNKPEPVINESKTAPWRSDLTHAIDSIESELNNIRLGTERTELVNLKDIAINTVDLWDDFNTTWQNEKQLNENTRQWIVDHLDQIDQLFFSTIKQPREIANWDDDNQKRRRLLSRYLEDSREYIKRWLSQNIELDLIPVRIDKDKFDPNIHDLWHSARTLDQKYDGQIYGVNKQGFTLNSQVIRKPSVQTYEWKPTQY